MSEQGTVDHATIAEAFVAAQAELPAVEPDAVNPHYRSRFVTLGHLLAKVRPVLNRHGIAVIQLPTRGEDGAPMLRTTLLHRSGERIDSDAPLILTRNDPQGQGSAITYLRRYSLGAALGISDTDDDDGNAGSPEPEPAEPVSAEDVALLEKLIRAELKLPPPRIALLFGAVGADAPADKKVATLRAALAALTVPQGDQMAMLLQRAIKAEGDGDVASTD